MCNIAPDEKAIAEEFARWATDQYHHFHELIDLYDHSEKRRVLLEETAKGFFGDLFWLYIEHLILEVSKLTDPPIMGGNTNLSIEYVHDLLRSRLGNRSAEAAKLVDDIKVKASGVRNWRRKLLAHNDYSVAIGQTPLTDKFVRGDFEQIFDCLAKFIEIVFASFGQVYDIHAISFDNATDLVGALKETQALRVLKKRDICAYHDLMTNSPFHDA
jgi:hypothetical protein